MSAKFYTLLTDIGAAKLTSATALGVPLKITQMAVGDGGGVLPTPNAQQTKLVGEKRRAALNQLYADPQNSSQIIAEQVIPETEGGWWIREVGLFDDTGALIAVGNCPESYKPVLTEGSGRTQTVRMVLITSSTDNITLKIDPSVVLATRQYADEKLVEAKTYAAGLLNGPTLTGTPKTPTPTAGDSSKAIANTEFVKTAIAGIVAAAPAALDTLIELAAALGNDPNFSTTVINALSGKQPLDTTLTNLSGKSVSGLLEYLGLGTGHVFLGKRAITVTGKVPKTPGAKWARIRAWSGGGGGGGAGRTVTAGNASQGYGGQSGTYIEIWINIETLTEFDCTIGLGGKGGAVSLTNTANPGTDGGATTITGILNCPGGKGGLGGILGTTLNTGISIVGTDLPTATQGTVIERCVADIGAPGAQVGSGPNQSLASRGGSAPGPVASVGGQAGRQISNADGSGGKGNGHAAGGGGGASITNSDGFGGGDATDGLILLEEFA